MKYFKILAIAATMLAGCHCAKKTTAVAADCKGEAIKDCMCTMQYDPVCGCDGKVYSNACVARCAGVKSWVKGECAGKQ